MTSPYGGGSPDRSAATGEGSPALVDSGRAPSRPAAPPAAPPAPAAPRAEAPRSEAPRTEAPRSEAPRSEAARSEAAREPRPTRDEPAEGRPLSRSTDGVPTTVLPGSSAATSAVRRPGPGRPAPARTPRPADSSGRAPSTKSRRARLALQRIDPWSVFLYTLLSSVFLGIALLVAVFVLYTVLGALGVPETVNELYTELTDAQSDLLTSGRVLTAAAVLAAVNVVLLTLLATLGALLYNLCASFTGGIELTLGERDS